MRELNEMEIHRQLKLFKQTTATYSSRRETRVAFLSHRNCSSPSTSATAKHNENLNRGFDLRRIDLKRHLSLIFC